MTDCQECGSKVADLDIFCPFCGISLQPIADPDKAAEDAFASTIVMSSPAVAESTPEDTSDFVVEDMEIATVIQPELGSEAAKNPPVTKSSEHLTDEYLPANVEEEVEKNSVVDLTSAATGTAKEKDGPADNHDQQPDAATGFDAEDSSNAISRPPADLPQSIDQSEAITETEVPAEISVHKDIGEGVDLVIEELDLASHPVAFSDLGNEGFDIGPVDEIAKEPVVEPEALQKPEEFLLDVDSGPSSEAFETKLGGNSETGNENPADLAEVVTTSSGEVAGQGGSFTTPNIGVESTDSRRSGLKPLAEGTLLASRYKISKKIGGGGMGAVYLATDLNLGNTQRAVKEMVQSHIEEDQQAKAIDDFRRESMILSTLDHPSIPTIYDYFYDEAESRFYLVMKYISGGDLASRLRSAPEGRIDERTVTEWALQIIDVLDYLHSLPTTIVYRDLKPSNVMIDGNSGKIMLIDFGIARSINQNQEKGVTAVGTMGYAPPELFSGQVEPRSDIYSLGSTMFHLLTGADPQNNPLLIFDFQKNPRPRQINPRLSDQMEKILMKAVEYSAEARFSTAADMRRTLHEHLEHLISGNVTYGISESPAAVSLAFQTVFCGFCGQRIVATDLFCAFCGSKQPIAQHGVHSEIYSRTSVTARLVIDGTSELDSPAFSLEKTENLVGRRDPMSNIFPEVDLSRYDPQTKISRRHARIWRDGKEYLVEDLGSSNGTLLLTRASDTLRLAPHSPHPLANGDRIRIGDTTLQFIVG